MAKGDNTVKMYFAGDEKDLSRSVDKVNRDLDSVMARQQKLAEAVSKSSRDIVLSNDKVEKKNGRLARLFSTDSGLMADAAAAVGTQMAGLARVVGNPYVAAIMAAIGASIALVATLGALSAAAGATALGLVGGMGFAAYKLLEDNERVKKSFSSLKDHMVARLREMAKPFESVFIGLAEKARSAFDRLSPSISAMFKDSAPLVDSLGQGFIGLAENALPGFQRGLAGAKPLIDAVADSMPRVGKAIGDFVDKLLNNPVLADIWGKMLGAITGVVEKLPRLVDIITQIWTALEPVRGAFSEVYNKLNELVAKAGGWGTILTFVLGSLAALGILLGAVFLGLIVTIGALVEKAVQLFGWLTTKISEGWAWLQEKWAQFTTWFFTKFNEGRDQVRNAIESVRNAWASLVADARSRWTGFQDWVRRGADSVAGFFDNLGNRITGAFRRAFNAAASMYNRTIGALSYNLPSFLGGGSFSMPKIPTFHTGGLVPGQAGQEVLAVLQAGERVIPANSVRHDNAGSRGGSRVVLEVRGDGEVAAFINKMIRTGQIQIA